eukprot:m51a1_g8439 putative alpha-mannosidase 2 (1068) ;mRNA; r:364807-369111
MLRHAARLCWCLALLAHAGAPPETIRTWETFNRDLPFANPDGGGFPLAFDSKAFGGEKINVFVVPWSHNDPGWRMTYDEYFAQQSSRILDTVVSALSEDASATFMWVETCFLQRWWDEHATPAQRAALRALARSGRFEVATGGWVMTDEASVHYEGAAQQLAEGHEWLAAHLGVRPRSGFSNDPFGFSPTVAHLAALSGIRQTVIHRVHYAIKKYLAQHKALEFVWRQRWEVERPGASASDVLTSVMPFFNYDIPHTCGPNPKVCAFYDFSMIGQRTLWGDTVVAPTPATLPRMAKELAEQYRQKAMLFRTNNVFVPLGYDFYYQTRDQLDPQLRHYADLMRAINADPASRLRVRFANLSAYLDAVAAAAPSAALPALAGDFFTYSDLRQDYWSGYFVSRPFQKRMSRILYSDLRVAEQLISWARMRGIALADDSAVDKLVRDARRTLGVFHHHDAITGTSANNVMADYAAGLSAALWRVHSVVCSVAAAHVLADPKANAQLLWPEDNPRHPMSTPQAATLDVRGSRTILVYNPLSFAREEVVSVWVRSRGLYVRELPGGRVVASQSCADAELLGDRRRLSFVAAVPAASFAAYEVAEAPAGLESAPCAAEDLPRDGLCLRSPRTSVCFEPTGEMRSVGGVSARESYARYSTQKTGAYVFRPTGEPERLREAPRAALLRGAVFDEVVTRWGETVRRSARLRHDDGGDHVDVAARVSVNHGELVARVDTSLASNGTFYTDQNGFDTARRYHRADLPIASNFYPVAAWLYAQGPSARLSVLARQPLGAACRGAPGAASCEVMLDRNAPDDDGKGLSDRMNDNVPVDEEFRVLAEPAEAFGADPDHQTRRALELAQRLNHPLVVLFGPADARAADLAVPAPQLRPGALPGDFNILRLRHEANATYTLVVARAPGAAERECFRLSGLFSDVGVVRATRHTLTFLEELGSVRPQAKLCVAPGDVLALRLVVSAAARGAAAEQPEEPSDPDADGVLHIDGPAGRPEAAPEAPRAASPMNHVGNVVFLMWLASVSFLAVVEIWLYHRGVLGTRGIVAFFVFVCVVNLVILTPSF